MKKCNACHNKYPLKHFSYDKCSPDGHQYRCKDCDKEKAKTYARKVRAEVLSQYGGKCACCGEDRASFLVIDHIDGGGLKHRKKIGIGGSNFYNWLKTNSYPSGFRVLCANCNHALGMYGICPHTTLPRT